MESLHIILGDKNPELVAAWEKSFRGLSNISIRGGNLLHVQADALVSPANSFGFMDGGFDWTISDFFEWKIQSVVQDAIQTKHAGELLVGQAEIVPTGVERFKYLICAPTMRIPCDVSSTMNAFLCMRAILLSVQQFNGASNSPIESVAIPGLCTGIGLMPYQRCAEQMRLAYAQFQGTGTNRYRALADAIREQCLLTGKPTR